MSHAADPRLERIRHLQARLQMRALDIELARLLLDLDSQADAVIGLAAAATSLALSEGHSCLSLGRLSDMLGVRGDEDSKDAAVPGRADLRQMLQASRLVGDAADAGARRPLVLDAGDRLYLRRYHRYEVQVAEALRGRLAARPARRDADQVRTALQQYFELRGDVPDWQALAVLAGLQSRLTVITGGPGTGKTTTVLWLLAVTVELALAAAEQAPRIALAAPTGKAAARLSESLRSRRAELACDDAVREAIPDTALTLHRLLGSRRGSSRFRHHAGHPLDADVVVVDEASMIDLPMMAHLLDALGEQTSLVLLGDRNQLASVEAGNVLSAICQAAAQGPQSRERAAWAWAVTGLSLPADPPARPFADQVVELHHNWRFDQHGGLDQLAQSVLAGDSQSVIDGLGEGRFAGVEWQPHNEGPQAIVAALGDHFAALANGPDAARVLARVQEHGVLTALREGQHGCEAINAAFERHLRLRAGVSSQQPWYRGRLLMILQNDYASALFNGDIGVVWPNAQGHLMACFAHADGVRQMPLSSLPAHASAWAMTIHKSQGSEYDRVSIVLPQTDARVLGRELLYTAVTRARKAVTLVSGEEALRHALGRSTRRDSGLAGMLEYCT